MVKTIYSTKEAAKLLNVTARTVQLWTDNGLLEAGKTPGGHRRIKGESLQHLIESMGSQLPSIPDNSNQNPGLYQLLMVDDDLDFQKLMRLRIERWHLPINIQTANDGYQGLIEMGHSKPNIILTDLNMPHMDGFHMLEIIQKNPVLADSQICIITGIDSEEIKQRGNLAENNYILTKPVDFNLLKDFLVGAIQTLNTSKQIANNIL